MDRDRPREVGGLTIDDPVIDALEAEQAVLAEAVSSLDSDDLWLASRCEGWSIAHVLVHLAQTNEFAVASVTGRFSEAVETVPDTSAVGDVDEWAALATAADLPDDPILARERWIASAVAQVNAFRAADASARVPWVAGEMAARTLATTRLSETWIHSNDIAAGLGITPEPTDRLRHIARLAHRTLPYAFARAGRELTGDVAFVLEAPEGSTLGGTEWTFGDPGSATVLTGPALELCEVAGQRAVASDTTLEAIGPDAEGVLELVRTFA